MTGCAPSAYSTMNYWFSSKSEVVEITYISYSSRLNIEYYRLIGYSYKVLSTFYSCVMGVFSGLQRPPGNLSLVKQSGVFGLIATRANTHRGELCGPSE